MNQLLFDAAKDGHPFLFVDAKGDHDLAQRVFLLVDGKADDQLAQQVLSARRRDLYRAECRRRGRRFLPVQVMRPIWAASVAP